MADWPADARIHDLDTHFRSLGLRRFVYGCHCGFVTRPTSVKLWAEINRLWHIFGRIHILFLHQRRRGING